MTRRAARWSKVWWLTPLATGLFLALVVEAAWLPDTMRYLGCQPVEVCIFSQNRTRANMGERVLGGSGVQFR